MLLLAVLPIFSKSGYRGRWCDAGIGMKTATELPIQSLEGQYLCGARYPLSDPVARAKPRMCVVRAGDPAGLGVLADHVVGLPPRDVHEVIGRATRREPAVCERSAEAVRVHVLNPRLLAPAPDHVTD